MKSVRLPTWLLGLILSTCLFFLLFVLAARPAQAQQPVTAQADHELLLRSDDAHLAANKRRVYDFWREVFEAGQLERAEQYLAEGYIQHNPNVPSGRAGFVEFFRKFSKPRPVAAHVEAPLVAIMAEGDLVNLVFVSVHPDPKAPGQTYTSTWFDLFRLDAQGRIVEHWDPDTRR
ncbi:nuclear transport factor 2 family protein [Paucibacter sp. DJ1R-11]|uniref:nuclear transport factor 2 family protein n=1 Tax=Paucibacter sp. DJ1R-11 TaxID=2893556 RepID=UPI0021E4D961|nr:nuclear transport factor 2 family protein [Paucibacter sp. DJ1R-11]MCV2363911.1 nuclear transport factor 2 family protein [Paucibacter sp. DJ1R-11]